MRQIKLHSANGTITANLKTEWEEFTTQEFMGMQGQSEAEVLSLFTGLTAEQVQAITPAALTYIAGFIEAMEPMPEQEYDLDIEGESIGQFECAKAHLLQMQQQYPESWQVQAMPYIYGVYRSLKVKNEWQESRSRKSAETCLSLPVTDVYPFAMFVYRQIEIVAEKYSGLTAEEYEEDELNAGIAELEAFGIYPTIRALAGRDLLKYESIMQLSVRAIYTELVYSKHESNYQEELNNIRKLNAA